jgi:hypothetical protein
MELKKITNKYLLISIAFLLIIFAYFETIMNLKLHFYKKYGYNSSILEDFENYNFTFSLIALLILIVFTKVGLHKNFKKIHLESIFLFGFIFDLIFGAIALLCLYEGTLNFYEDNMWFYRFTYFLIALPFLFLIYEILINKSENIFPNLKRSNTKEKIYTDSTELDKLKKLGIIDDNKYSSELNKIKKEKILVDIKNTSEYKEFYHSLKLALSKDFITKNDMEKKLWDKENELYKHHKKIVKKNPPTNETEILTDNNKFIIYIFPLAIILAILLFIVIMITPVMEELF